GIQTIRKGLIRRDSVELACRLIEPRVPGSPAIKRDHGSLIGAHQDALWIFGSNPKDVVVLTARSSLPCNKGAPTITRTVSRRLHDVNDIRVFRVRIDAAKIFVPENARVVGDLLPIGARVV